MFGISLISSMVLKFILSKGLDYAEFLSEKKKEEIKAFVYKIVPGSMFDETAWEIVSAMLPKLFAAAHLLIQTQGHSSAVSEAQVVNAVLACK